MPHSCAVCGAVYTALAELDRGACPICHACKFIYEASNNAEQYAEKALFEEEELKRNDAYFTDAKPPHKIKQPITQPEQNLEPYDDTVSVHIRRPGTYEINLRQMVESSDRIVCFDKKGTYHLDLHSMMGKKKP